MLNPQRVLKYPGFDEYIYKSISLQNQLVKNSLFLPFLYYYIMGNNMFPFLSLTMANIKLICLLSSYFWFHFLPVFLGLCVTCSHISKKKRMRLKTCLLLYFISHTHISCLL